jgi:predicted ATP-grasp superfamily ATP-dependent carboligase
MAEFVWRDEVPPEKNFGTGSVVVTAFPSAGLATTVAGHWAIRALKLPRIGRFESPDPSPIAIVSGGEVNPIVRAYGRPDLALVLSEFPPTPAQASSLARTILDSAESHHARMIVALEGVVQNPEAEDGETEAPAGPSTAAADVPEGEEPGQVWVAFSRRDPSIQKTFEAAQTRALEDGVIGGVSGGLLVQGIARRIPVAVLLVSARVAGGLPDHRAGAALIETLDRLLPEVAIDTQPLRAQAQQIEKALRAAMRSHSSSSSSSAPPAATAGSGTGMYG